jgi:hypothetical protein
MNALRQALIDLDLPLLRTLLPRPDAEILATAHYARTQANTIPLRLRVYSHHWLLDHNLPSGLPDRLKPIAERLYPREVTAVGIAVKSANAALAKAVEKAMSDTVAEMYADGVTDPGLIKPRMAEVRDRILES